MSITAIGFLVAYFGCLFRAFTKKPIWGLYAYLIAFYAHPISRWWGDSLPNLRWSFLAAIITLVAVVISKNNHSPKWFEYKESKLYAIFLTYITFQFLWALNTSIHSVFVVLVIKYLIVLLLIHQCVRTKQQVIGFILINVLGGMYFGYLGMSHSSGRLEGVGGPSIESSNGLGQHLSILLVFSSYLLFVIKGKARLGLILGILLILNTIMLTGSRGSIVSILATGLISMWFIPKGYKKSFIGLAILGLTAFTILLGPQIIERFQGVEKDSSGEIDDKSARSRLVVIKAQYEMAKESPFLGQGHRTTLLLSPYYIPKEYMTKVKGKKGSIPRRASHNFIMGMWTDHGLIGLFIYGIIIYSIAKHLLRLKKYRLEEASADLIVIQTGLCLGFLCYLFAGLFSNNKIYEIAVWLIAIIPIVDKLLKKSITEKEHVTRCA